MTVRAPSRFHVVSAPDRCMTLLGEWLYFEEHSGASDVLNICGPAIFCCNGHCALHVLSCVSLCHQADMAMRVTALERAPVRAGAPALDLTSARFSERACV
eukprot:6187441-Pleurochrysis_carterae.AAC.2